MALFCERSVITLCHNCADVSKNVGATVAGVVTSAVVKSAAEAAAAAVAGGALAVTIILFGGSERVEFEQVLGQVLILLVVTP